MRKFFFTAVASLAVFAAAPCLAAPSVQPLALSVTNLVPSYGPVKFYLDKKYVCSVDGDDQCIFSTDCSNFAKQPCVQVDIKAGKHLVKVDYGDGQFSRWVKLDRGGVGGADSHVVEWSFGESMGIPKLLLNCG